MDNRKQMETAMNLYAIAAFLICCVAWGFFITKNVPTCELNSPGITIGNMLVAGCKEASR